MGILESGRPFVSVQVLRLSCPMRNITYYNLFRAYLYDCVVEFLLQVDWSEKWLHCLAAFHVGTLLCIITTRKYINFQLILFMCLCKYVQCNSC